MEFAPTFLRSTVARRIFVLFVGATLIPCIALAVISFSHVSHHIATQSEQRLRRATKAHGMAVHERLLLLETELKAIALHLVANPHEAPSALLDGRSRARFRSLAVPKHTDSVLALPTSPLGKAQRRHLADRRTVLCIRPGGPGAAGRLLLARRLGAKGHILMGEIDPAYLWGADTLPPHTEMCVLDHAKRTLARTPGLPPSISSVAQDGEGGSSGYVTCRWSVFLKARFLSPECTVVLAEPRSEAFAAADTFKRHFTLVILLSLLVVVFLCVRHIGKILNPLTALRRMTTGIARGRFDERVDIGSGDEFQELAVSFNTMAERLGRQFNGLATMAEVGRAILLSLKTERIIETVLARLPEIVPCDAVGITLLSPDGTAVTHIADGDAPWTGEFDVDAWDRLEGSPDGVVLSEAEFPPFLRPLAEQGATSALVQPLYLTRGLAGAICLGRRTEHPFDQEALESARHLADQTAAGLSNALLIGELEQTASELSQANDALQSAITRRELAESELVEGQKMESIGRLAGGIAHDFNNKLAVVMGYAELAMADLGMDHPAREDMMQIMTAGEQAAALTRQLLAFGRKQVLEPQVLNLNELVERSIELLDRVIGENIRLVFSRGSALRCVRVDPTQLERVIMNLAVNARDAMPEGGVITIETANVTLDDEALTGRPGRYTLLTLHDTGSGMDEETRSRIFEPFFTTKADGVGTGLGLSVIHGVVKQSGGHIRVQSEVGQGTSFRIYLPAVDEPASECRDGESPAPVAGGSETILLVEDQGAVRDLVKRVLTQAGYEVLDAPDGKRALDLLWGNGRIQLLLTDLIMPGMGGVELARRAQASQEDLAVVYLSGYVDHELACRNAVLIRKPVTSHVLLAKIREVLDAQTALPAETPIRPATLRRTGQEQR